jgi:hypothetical protein
MSVFNKSYYRMFKPKHLTLGVIFAIEAYEGAIPKMERQIELAYRAFSQDAEDNKKSVAMGNLTMPVLVLSCDVYQALGGDFPGNTILNSTPT